MENMEDKINRKSTLKAVILCVVAVVVIGVVGISFAYFTVNFESGDLYTIGGKAKNTAPTIEFSENKPGISLDGTYPMPDEVGLEKSDEYTFTVTSKEAEQYVRIDVYLQVAETNTLADNLVNISYNGEIKTVGGLETGDTVDTGFNKAYKIGSFILNKNGSKSNSVKMWVNKDGTVENALNKNWNSKIYVIPSFTDEEPFVKTGKATEVLLSRVNDESITDYNSGNKEEMYTFSHDATEQTEALIDYRYIGNTPNNYGKFNNETWRIIGVFTVEGDNGEKEQRIKIIRDETIGNFTWDKKADGTTINEWPSSTLSTMLNGDYVNSGGNFTYTWYDSSGTVRTSTVPGLNLTAKMQIAPTKWYLGVNTTNYEGSDYYNLERGTTVVSGNSTNIVANVGLMYPSDYIYTYANGVDNTCYTTANLCDTGSAGWLFIAFRWTMSTVINPTLALVVNLNGSVRNYSVSNLAYVYPSVYLRSDIEIMGGDGSSGNPYILKSSV